MGGNGRKGIPLHEAGEHLRQQLASQGEGDGIVLDTSPEAAKLPTTDIGTGKKIELHTIDLDRRAQDEAESYDELKRLYLAGELNVSDIKDVFLNPAVEKFFNAAIEQSANTKGEPIPASRDRLYSSPDTVAAQRLLDEINEGKLPPQSLGWRAPEGAPRPQLKREGERWADQAEHKVFLELCQEYTKGMPFDEMRKRYIKGTKNSAERRVAIEFLNKHRDGFNPSAFLMNEVMLAQPGLKAKELTQEDWQQANEKFLRATREVWGPFAYSGKWQKNQRTGEYEVTDDADLDAKTSLLLLRLSKIDSALKGKPFSVSPGEYRPGATTIDSGLKSGVVVEQGGTVIIDNHQRTRGYETSSAKILYNLLRAKGDISEAGSLRALVEFSVLDDNARLLTNREQLDASDRTLRGLHRFMTSSRLLDYFEDNWGRAAGELRRERKLNRTDKLDSVDIQQHLLNYKLSDAELKRWGLEDGAKDQRRTINRAHELLLDVQEEKLIEDGRVAQSKLGKLVLNIEGMEKLDQEPGKKWFDGKKFKGGHDTVIADGRFQGYLSWDEPNQSLLLNTTDRNLDLSVAFKDILTKHPELVCVRGALIIKPKNGKPLSVGFTELLTELGVDIEHAQGQLKQYLERGLPLNTASRAPAAEKSSQRYRDVPKGLQSRAREMVKDFQKGNVPTKIQPSAGKVMGAYGISRDDIATKPVADLLAELAARLGMEVPPTTPGVPPVVPSEREQVAEVVPVTVPPGEEQLPAVVESSTSGEPGMTVGEKPAVEEAAGTQLPAREVEPVTPPPVVQETPEPTVEGWVDGSGIKFSRELTPDEEKAKDEVDDEVLRRLVAKAREALRDPRNASEDVETFVDGFVERGLAHSSILAVRTRLYRERGLPVVEAPGSSA